MKLTVEFEWTTIGKIRDDSGRLRFPAVADVPGAYRFELPNRMYIGETDRLKRRFQHYRTPGTSQATNLRLNAILRDLMASGTNARVGVVTAAIVEVDEQHTSLDLSRKAARLLVESAALTVEHLNGRQVENL